MSASERNQTTMPRCPACRQAGQPVKRVTLESLLRPEQRERIGDAPYFVCLTPACDGVYFGSGDATPFGKTDLRVRFGLKETAPPRLVCYCFQHTIEEIEDEVRRTGRSTVVERIKADMKGPGCRCESTNPLGACCLKSVQTVVDEALRQAGREPAVADTVDGLDEDCCSDNRRNRSGALALGGSVVAAALSSACCWLPLLLVAFGVSAVGMASFFEAYRPYLLVVAIGLLGAGFYRVYFRKERCAPGSACPAPNRKLRILNQAMLWSAAVLVGAFALFPSYVGALVGEGHEDPAAAARV
ncbi:MAG: mercuric transporter MerT family protein, partial [Phycisphaerae bacterium]